MCVYLRLKGIVPPSSAPEWEAVRSRRKFEGPSTRRESIFSDTLRTLKQSRGNRSKEKAADVSHVSDASRLHIGHGTHVSPYRKSRNEVRMEEAPSGAAAPTI